MTFLVEDLVRGWVEVDLPLRPSGSTGWIRAADLRLTTTRYRIDVHLSAHSLDVYDGTRAVMHEVVAIGAPATPTPTGHFFIRALLRAATPGTVYGPFAYALSGFSQVLDTFDGSDAEIGIHGNDDPTVLGHDVSHGCIRMSNEGITDLAGMLPLGTPVDIEP